MTKDPKLETPRLQLRRWELDDLPRFAALNADPDVMAHFASPLSKEETADLIARFESSFEEHRFGVWAVEVKWARAFIGMCGLSVPGFEAPFMPAVEVGWRFAKETWGNGYATEAAEAAISYGFAEVGLEEIVSFTAVGNQQSRRVMERLGMTHRPEDDFDHPNLPEDHHLRRHVLSHK